MRDLSQYASVTVVVLLTAFNPSPLVLAEAGREENIRSIDFRNFTYPISGESAEMVKAKSIRVRDGKFERQWNDAVASHESFSFLVESVSYGDLDGDGKEEAVVHASLSWMGGVQQWDSHIYVYAVSRGKPALLNVPELDINWDYIKWNKSKDWCDEDVFSWSAEATREGLMKVDAIIGNQHRCYDDKKGYNMVTMKYRLINNRWVLEEPPKRWRKK